jgi:error-prone DNA polymerase
VQRHGVKVLPVDATESVWDCTLARQPDGTLAIRLGFRLVKGISKDKIHDLVEMRARTGGIDNVATVIGSAPWMPREVFALAGSGSLDALSSGRREALWDALGVETAVGVSNPHRKLTTGLRTEEDEPHLPGLGPLETMLLDYTHTGLSVKDHPVRHLRDQLTRTGVITCAALQNIPHGQPVRVCGLSITRQRPGTASGVVFVTLEDETGTANIVLWSTVFERFNRVARTAAIMEVRGRLERDGDVIHVIAQYLHEWKLPRLNTKSRDFR